MGSCTVDNFIIINSKYRNIKPGDKLLIENTFTEIGGSASNSSISLAKFGLNVKIITKLGNDHNALIIRHKLNEKKIRLFYNTSEKYMTPFAIILASKNEKDRIVFAYKGASNHLNKRDVPLREINTSWLYIGSLLDNSFKTAEEIAMHCREKKFNVVLNPSTYLARKGKKKLKKILAVTKLLVLNKEEAQYMLEKKHSDRELLKEIKRLGPEIVIITDGKNPIHAIDQSHIYKLKPYKVKVLSTLGAGDAFAAGFLGSYIKTKNIKLSLKIGAANSAAVLQHYGATTGTLSYKHAFAYVKKHSLRIQEFSI
ncbi:MAG: carbohydrate kinase family protein [Nanoarchaeota archaeon]